MGVAGYTKRSHWIKRGGQVNFTISQTEKNTQKKQIFTFESPIFFKAKIQIIEEKYYMKRCDIIIDRNLQKVL